MNKIVVTERLVNVEWNEEHEETLLPLCQFSFIA